MVFFSQCFFIVYMKSLPKNYDRDKQRFNDYQRVNEFDNILNYSWPVMVP